MKAVRPAQLASHLAAFLSLAGREAIAVVRSRDRDDTHSPDVVDFVAMPFSALPASIVSKEIPIPILKTYVKDGLIGSGKAGVVLRVTPPRMPPVALLSAADHRRLMNTDPGVLQLIKL